jgi:peroxiredoxin
VLQAREDFARLGAEIVVVSFATVERLADFFRDSPLPFPVFSAPDRLTYRAFGLVSAGWRTLFSFSTLAKYFKFALKGRIPERPKEDIYQLGGDFVLDSRGRIIYALASRDPADRPTVDTLLNALKTAAKQD